MQSQEFNVLHRALGTHHYKWDKNCWAISDFLKNLQLLSSYQWENMRRKTWSQQIRSCCCLEHQQQGWVSSPSDVSPKDFSSLRYQDVHHLFSSVLILFHKSLYSRSFYLTVFLALGKNNFSQISFLLEAYWNL